MSEFDSQEFVDFVGGLAEDTGAFVRRKVNPLEVRLAAVEARLAQMLPTLTLDTDAEGRAQVKLIDGTRTTTVTVPGLLDRGPWRAGVRYLKGDCVSYQRSLFICQRDCPVGKPEDHTGSWRLAVMRGRDVVTVREREP